MLSCDELREGRVDGQSVVSWLADDREMLASLRTLHYMVASDWYESPVPFSPAAFLMIADELVASETRVADDLR
jgi:hypothetical protein